MKKGTREQAPLLDPTGTRKAMDMLRKSGAFDQKRMEELAAFLKDHHLTLKQLTSIIQKSDITGWKEAIGSITRITGLKVEELGVTSPDKIMPFAANPDTTLQTQWKALNRQEAVDCI